MASESQLTQKQIAQLVLPVLQKEGAVFLKSARIWAKQAVGGELVVSKVSDGIETQNTASEGDYIVKNDTEAGEMYVVESGKFLERYEFDEEAEGKFSRYLPKGRVVAVRMSKSLLERLHLPSEFKFTASWGEPQVSKLGAYLVSPVDYSEVYRIAAKEFSETYKLDFDANES